MADWAIVGAFGVPGIALSPAGHPGPQVATSAIVFYMDDAVAGQREIGVAIGTSAVADINTRFFPVGDLLDGDVIKQHIITSVIEVGANLTSLGNPRNYFVDAAHVSFLPPDLPFPLIPEGVPAGVIAVLSDVAPVPSGWALCDGTSGTPDLTDVFRPKDHVVYIQKL